MMKKLMLALLLLGTVCLMPAGPGARPAFGLVDCSSTCTPTAKRQCQSSGGFCGYNPDFGTCGCVYP